MDAELIVVGAGFWGTAITLALRSRGRTVICLDGDCQGAASQAAGGFLEPAWLDRPAFLPAWWEPRHSQACRDFTSRWARPCGQNLYHRSRPQVRYREGLWRVDCPHFLGQAGADRARVERLERGWRAHTTGGSLAAPWVVLAAGYASDALLRDSRLDELGIQPLPGRGLYFRSGGELRVPLTLTYRLPGESRTRKATATPWNELLRAGDTVENSSHDLPPQLQAVREVARRAGGLEEVGERMGIRPVLPRLFVEEVAPRLIVATGGRRNGLITGAGAALRVCELVEGQENGASHRKYPGYG